MRLFKHFQNLQNYKQLMVATERKNARSLLRKLQVFSGPKLCGRGQSFFLVMFCFRPNRRNERATVIP